MAATATPATYERLERQRLKSLGLNEKYSRYYLDKMSSPLSPTSPGLTPRWSTSDDDDGPAGSAGVTTTNSRSSGGETTSRPRGPSSTQYNCVSPFSTSGKTTCGYFFTEKSDNRRKDFGIAPADLPRWRSDAAACSGNNNNNANSTTSVSRASTRVDTN